MRRWLLNILAAGSVLVFVGICVLWIRSYFVADKFVKWSDGGAVFNATANSMGRIAAGRVRMGGEFMRRSTTRDPHSPPLIHVTVRPARDEDWEAGVQGQPNTVRMLGIVILWRNRPDPSGITESAYLLIIPHYWFLVFCLPMPALWLRRWRRERRQHFRARLGLCLVCGYDLRATPHRCPECGTVPAQ